MGEVQLLTPLRVTSVAVHQRQVVHGRRRRRLRAEKGCLRTKSDRRGNAERDGRGGSPRRNDDRPRARCAPTQDAIASRRRRLATRSRSSRLACLPLTSRQVFRQLAHGAIEVIAVT
jgi:hypothetical protein